MELLYSRANVPGGVNAVCTRCVRLSSRSGSRGEHYSLSGKLDQRRAAVSSSSSAGLWGKLPVARVVGGAGATNLVPGGE